MIFGLASIAPAQVIFDENFDGGYTGAFSTGSYQGGPPTGTTNMVLASGGNPGGCWEETMTATASSDYYTGQVQLSSVSGNTDPSPADYVLSFDAYGSQAANIQFIIQTWPDDYYGGTQAIQATVNDPLNAANTWQTFSVNLGDITTSDANDATWQLEFQISASQWGGVGLTDTLRVDNIVLTHLGNSLALTSSANPSTFGGSVTLTATVLTNGVTAGNATGQVVFSSPRRPVQHQHRDRRHRQF